ncbi:hypothetical protein BTN50_0907 [Candidatus Enterovibrio altilux]|uniref:Uncharacterized protein n=1 Tax=Candidatus Enterovibrio altilux TaxID=1927128 RepID=A0A291B8T3_9GAMM|nr:hypothetical protein BTN50_0907 [Candidatus Enterovibrio luxaltus]
MGIVAGNYTFFITPTSVITTEDLFHTVGNLFETTPANMSFTSSSFIS